LLVVTGDEAIEFKLAILIRYYSAEVVAPQSRFFGSTNTLALVRQVRSGRAAVAVGVIEDHARDAER